MSPQEPTATRNTIWLALLVAASIVFSFTTTCATPFAAFAVIAALTQSRRNALCFTGAVWLANQLVGFCFLSYPWTLECMTWGIALGVTAVFSMLAAQWVGHRMDGMGYACIAAAFAAAFLTYEGMLFAISLVMGGTEDYTLAIIGYILSINAGALIGLLALNRLGSVIGFASAYTLRMPAAQKHA